MRRAVRGGGGGACGVGVGGGLAGETRGTADMIGVRMTVNNMGDRLVGDFGDRLGNQRGVAGRRVYHDNAPLMDQEHGLLGVLNTHVAGSAEGLGSIAPLPRLRWSTVLARTRHLVSHP